MENEREKTRKKEKKANICRLVKRSQNLCKYHKTPLKMLFHASVANNFTINVRLIDIPYFVFVFVFSFAAAAVFFIKFKCVFMCMCVYKLTFPLFCQKCQRFRNH